MYDAHSIYCIHLLLLLYICIIKDWYIYININMNIYSKYR